MAHKRPGRIRSTPPPTHRSLSDASSTVPLTISRLSDRNVDSTCHFAIVRIRPTGLTPTYQRSSFLSLWPEVPSASALRGPPPTSLRISSPVCSLSAGPSLPRRHHCDLLSRRLHARLRFLYCPRHSRRFVRIDNTRLTSTHGCSIANTIHLHYHSLTQATTNHYTLTCHHTPTSVSPDSSAYGSVCLDTFTTAPTHPLLTSPQAPALHFQPQHMFP